MYIYIFYFAGQAKSMYTYIVRSARSRATANDETTNSNGQRQLHNKRDNQGTVKSRSSSRVKREVCVCVWVFVCVIVWCSTRHETRRRPGCGTRALSWLMFVYKAFDGQNPKTVSWRMDRTKAAQRNKPRSLHTSIYAPHVLAHTLICVLCVYSMRSCDGGCV